MSIVKSKARSQQIENSDLTRKELILAERERYLAGIGKSYCWNEVKNMAIKKVNLRPC